MEKENLERANSRKNDWKYKHRSESQPVCSYLATPFARFYIAWFQGYMKDLKGY
jgi:hypothetical protein